jgi:hypothetical protein
VERFYGAGGPGLWRRRTGLRDTLNTGRWKSDMRLKLNGGEGVSCSSNLERRLTKDDPQRLERRRLEAARTGARRSRPSGSSRHLSTRGLDLRGQLIEWNSPRMFMCGGGDWKVSRNGGLTLPSFDGSERLLISSSGFRKQFK